MIWLILKIEIKFTAYSDANDVIDQVTLLNI